MQKLLDQMDTDASGDIDKEEFILFWRQVMAHGRKKEEIER